MAGHRLSLKLIVLTTIVAGGFAAAIPAPAVVKDASCLIRGQEQPGDSCNNIHDPNKDGPYTYGYDAPFPNTTSTSATLTITLTSTKVVTETDAVCSLSGFTLSPNATAITTSNDTFHAQTATDSSTFVLVSSAMDGQTNSMTSSNNVQSSIISSTDTANASLPMPGCTGTPTSDDQYSSTQLSVFTTMPHITLTTTILYSTSDSEEFTSTETVTETPLVTVTKGTTITLSSAPETTVTATVTVYVSQLQTQTQTGENSGLVSAADITVSEVVTATIVQTVSPVPTGTSTTMCTESSMTESDYVVPTSPSRTTIRSTLTVTVTSGSLASSTDVSPETTVETSVKTTTVTVSTGTSVDTTCKTSSAAISSESSTTATSSATTTHTPYPTSDTPFGSVVFANSTMTVTVGTITVPANVTAETTKHRGSTHTPHFHSTGSITTAYPANPTVPINSGAGLGKKRPVKIFWGDGDGGTSSTCVILLVMIISLLL
ncbi:hypothetical protein GGR58DRAFT_526090 [Xylaria digitata]|nr:hypothetical protein GGR58DRAFT_526090 [Xylaria digitata]